MGLDIYFHHTKRKFNDDIDSFMEQVDKDAQKRIKKKIDENIKELENAWKEYQKNNDSQLFANIYNSKYFSFVEKLRPILAEKYDWKIYSYCNGVMTFPALKQQLERDINGFYQYEDAYFRKANFLFAYFENKGTMLEDRFSIVTKEDVEDIIKRCEYVLEDHNVADAELPTRAGFFFGSTEHDKWYYKQVENCHEQMKEYLKLFKSGITGYVYFSW